MGDTGGIGSNDGGDITFLCRLPLRRLVRNLLNPLMTPFVCAVFHLRFGMFLEYRRWRVFGIGLRQFRWAQLLRWAVAALCGELPRDKLSA